MTLMLLFIVEKICKSLSFIKLFENLYYDIGDARISIINQEMQRQNALKAELERKKRDEILFEQQADIIKQRYLKVFTHDEYLERQRLGSVWFIRCNRCRDKIFWFKGYREDIKERLVKDGGPNKVPEFCQRLEKGNDRCQCGLHWNDAIKGVRWVTESYERQIKELADFCG